MLQHSLSCIAALIVTMEAAVRVEAVYKAATPATLITSLVSAGDAFLSKKDVGSDPSKTSALSLSSSHRPRFCELNSKIPFCNSPTVNGVVQIPHATVIEEGSGLIFPDDPTSASTPVVEVSSSVDLPMDTVIIPMPATTTAPQFAVDPTVNPLPPDQALSSFEECQRTVTPGGICMFPPAWTLPDPKPLPSTSSTSLSSPPVTTAPVTTVPLTTAPTSSPSSSAVSVTPPSSLPPSTTTAQPNASQPVTIPPAAGPPHKTPIIVILIPCALAAAGIIAFAAFCVIWRKHGKRASPSPPSTISEKRSAKSQTPDTIDEQKVFRAGNFATAEAFRPGIVEMETKRKWTGGGFRSYRDSWRGSSGFLSKWGV